MLGRALSIVVPQGPDHVPSEPLLKLPLAWEGDPFGNGLAERIERKCADQILERPVRAQSMGKIEKTPAELVYRKGERRRRDEKTLVEAFVKEAFDDLMARRSFEFVGFIDYEQVEPSTVQP